MKNRRKENRKIKNKDINFIINTPSGSLSHHDDSYIRKAAIKYGVFYATTLGFKAVHEGEKKIEANCLQEYHAQIQDKYLPSEKPEQEYSGFYCA